MEGRRITSRRGGPGARALAALAVVALFALAAAASAQAEQETPVVTGVSPNIGPLSGGTTVTVTGQHLENATSVNFNFHGTQLHASEILEDTSEAVTVKTPAGPESGSIRIAAPVSVTTPGGTSAENGEVSFTYVGPPGINSPSPATGPASGGTQVVLEGNNVDELTAVDFGATPASEFTVIKEPIGRVKVTATAPAGTGNVEISVTTRYGGTSLPDPQTRYIYKSGPPELGRCVGVGGSPNEGHFKVNTCLAFSAFEQYFGGFEWEPGVVKGGFTGKGTTKVTFESTGHVKITCTGVADSGAFSGETAVTGVVITFTGCASATKQPCTTSGDPSGEIQTATLEATLGWTTVGKKAGVDLAPTGGGSFAGYTCAGTTTTLSGSVIVPISTADSMVTVNTWKAVEKEGKQVPEAFAGGAQDVLRNQNAEQVGVTAALTQTTEEALELNVKF